MKILVCTDGSATSLGILPSAGRLARALGGEIVLTRVLDPRVDAASVVSPNLADAVAAVQTGWEGSLRQALKEANLEGSVVVPHRVWGKEVADAIHLAADDENASMVALSSRGAGAIRHALFGSVALGVISRADLPVMTLSSETVPVERDGPYHILITSDGSADARSIFAGLQALLVPTKVKVTLLEIAVLKARESEAEATERVRGGLERLLSRIPGGVEAGVEVGVVPPGVSVDSAIVEAARRLGVDAIASATHGHSARRHLLAGSTALGVVEKSERPVILVKSHAVE